jgi:hypothetical protein
MPARFAFQVKPLFLQRGFKVLFTRDGARYFGTDIANDPTCAFLGARSKRHAEFYGLRRCAELQRLEGLRETVKARESHCG